MSTKVQDYLTLTDDELTTLILVSDREDDIVKFFDKKVLQNIDRVCQKWTDDFIEKHKRDPSLEEWLKFRVPCLRIALGEINGTTQQAGEDSSP